MHAVLHTRAPNHYLFIRHDDDVFVRRSLVHRLFSPVQLYRRAHTPVPLLFATGGAARTQLHACVARASHTAPALNALVGHHPGSPGDEINLAALRKQGGQLPTELGSRVL